MSKGEGKGWAKGRTAATDSRIARNAAAHSGLTYVRRTPIEKCLWARGSARTLPLEWSPTMAYVVGLMATDGCLLERRKQLNFKSEDRQLVETFLTCLGRQPVVSTAMTPKGKPVYLKQFGDVAFYRWLEGVGLMPRKSLILGAIQVPDELVGDCARGLLDGDGSITNYWYDGTGKAAGRRYEGLTTAFNSASRPHLEWLRASLDRVLGVRGSLVPQPPSQYGTIMYRLAYAIRESSVLLPRIYPTADVPCLVRKWLIWKGYSTRHGLRTTHAMIAEDEGSYLVA